MINEVWFIESIRQAMTTAHTNAMEKGFYGEPYNMNRNVGEAIALMHSELSEALEAHLHGNPPSDHIPEFSGLEEEFADLLIRVFDTAYALDL